MRDDLDTQKKVEKKEKEDNNNKTCVEKHKKERRGVDIQKQVPRGRIISIIRRRI